MVNTITLIGHLGKDPETKVLESGSSVTGFTLATSRSWKNAQGEKVEKTEWHNVVLWNKLGELAQQYLRKGSKVFIQGRVDYRTSESNGTTRYYTDIVAEEMKFLDSRRDNSDRFPTEEPARRVSPTAVANTVAAQFADEPVAEPKATDNLPF